MKNKLIVLLLFFVQYYYTFATTIENVNYNNNNENENTGCRWPCPNEFDICQLSKVDGIMSCQPLQDKQWIIPFPQGKPVFYVKNQSSLSKLYQSCDLAPKLLFTSSSDNHNNNDKKYGNKEEETNSGTCAPELLCIHGQCEQQHNKRRSFYPLHNSHQRLERRESGNTFSQSTEHTTAFNVIHVIAAIVGILGAAFVGVTVFIMCRRRQRRLEKQNNSFSATKHLRHTQSTSSSHSSTTTSTSSTSTTTTTTTSPINNDIPPTLPIQKSMDRFNQFAQAYEDSNNDSNQVLVPPHVYSSKSGYNRDITSVSPSMQQMHLHSQLLYQSSVHRNNSTHHEHHTLNHNHHFQQQEPSSSALLPPPPPYQP